MNKINRFAAGGGRAALSPTQPRNGKKKKEDGIFAGVQETPTQRVVYLGPRFEPSNIWRTATATSLKEAVEQAENGDTQNLFRFYRDVLLSDDHIQGELSKRKLAVLAQPMGILPVDKKNLADLVAVKAVKRMMKDCENWLAGLGSLLGGSLWPVVLVEKVFRPADAPKEGEPPLRFTLKRLEGVNPLLLCFRWAYMTGGVGLGTKSPIQSVNLGTGADTLKSGLQTPWQIDLNRWEPFLKLWPVDQDGRILFDTANAQYVDPLRYMVHRGHLLTDQRDNWGGPMRAIMGWSLLRSLGRDWFGRFMERYGNPFAKGKTDVEDPARIELLREAFAMASKIGGIVIGQEDEVELVEAAVAGGAEGHERWHIVCNNAISRAIVGQDLSSSAQPTGMGSGVSNLQADVRQDIRMWDQMMLSESVIKQLVDQFLKINGLNGQVTVVFGGLSEEDAGKLGGVLVQLTQAGLRPTDEALPTISERVGFDVERGPDLTADNADGADLGKGPKMFSAALSPTQPRAGHPSDAVAARKAVKLAAAFRGAHAPVRAIVMGASSAADLERKLRLFYADWDAGKIQEVVGEVLQICAAEGAGDGESNQ